MKNRVKSVENCPNLLHTSPLTNRQDVAGSPDTLSGAFAGKLSLLFYSSVGGRGLKTISEKKIMEKRKKNRINRRPLFCIAPPWINGDTDYTNDDDDGDDDDEYCVVLPF